jgi:porphobilinogen synthase
MRALEEDMAKPAAQGATSKIVRGENERGGVAFPRTRMRRTRSNIWVRDLVAENRLDASDLIWPIFLREDDNPECEVTAMPGVRRFALDEIVDAVGHAADLGVRAVALFPNVPPNLKTVACDEAVNPHNLVCRATRRLKGELPEVGVICDVALDPYNSLGHDGLVVEGRVLNDETNELLVQQSLIQAEAGCDILAPSDMMDGRIAAIRDGLESAGYLDVKICSYAAKYASAFYGPFRSAVGSGGALKGDKKTYQMDPANSDEAIREVALDLQEGADMVMVKPGMPYLDIIHRVKEHFGVPTLAYQVSGEYAMIQAAAQNGWLDGETAMLESLLAFKRAGADAVLSYFSVAVAERLRRG